MANSKGESARILDEQTENSIDVGSTAEAFHEVANAWPMMTDAEIDGLAEDILANGVHYAIWRHRDGRIIDGRNRWTACQKVGVECPSNTYTGDDSGLVEFVVSLNDKRRHQSESQRAIVAAKLANLKVGRPSENASTEAIKPVSQAKAAELLQVSRSSVQRAHAILDDDDGEMVSAVERGELTVRAAAGKVSAKRQQKPDPIAPRPPHVVQFSNLIRALGLVLDDFADAAEAASLCARFDANVSDGVVEEIIEFLAAFSRARNAGQAAR